MPDDEDTVLRAAALQNVQSILQARQRAEQELIQTKEALEEETRVLELLNESGALLASKLDLQSVVETVIDAATQLSGGQLGAFIYTARDATGELTTHYTLSAATRDAVGANALANAGELLATSFLAQGVTRVGDLRNDARFRELALGQTLPLTSVPLCSYLAVPVLAARSRQLLGALFFGHREPNAFSERSERLMLGIAAQAAIAIENSRMYEEATRAADERARLLASERLARVEVERVSLMKDEFLATLSHELRTPLNAILGWAHVLLARTGEEESSARHGLEAIMRNARAQAQLIEDLLDMNRIVSGTIRLDVQPIDLASVVAAALDAVQPSADAKAITLRKTIDPNAGPILGDPNRLQQIVWNLLTNAVKFTPKGGKIDVIVQRVNSHVEIIVHDSGIGIGADFLPHVFERFRQADSSATRKYGGLGLGLSIVKQLVELHGGSVKVDSLGEGEGATFVVNLPVRALRDSSPSTREHPTSGNGAIVRPPAVSLAGIKVLVVDDEADARELVKSVLSDAAADVCTAGSADEGYALVISYRPHVIVSDIGMPGRDGYEFIRHVRGLAPASGGRTPAIALTAFARSEDRTRAMLAGYQVHVSKPIEPQELVATIKSLASNSRDLDR
jgi:signal transduction histidine kinase/ActR/RegA family two-component response regulator